MITQSCFCRVYEHRSLRIHDLTHCLHWQKNANCKNTLIETMYIQLHGELIKMFQSKIVMHKKVDLSNKLQLSSNSVCMYIIYIYVSMLCICLCYV